MPDRLITHLRHVDLAVPDYARQREFYAGVWGLTEVAGDTGISFLAAEGSPEQYIVRLRKAGEKRLDLVSFGAASAADVDALAERLGAAGVRLVGEPGGWPRPAAGTGSGSSTSTGGRSRCRPTSPSARTGGWRSARRCRCGCRTSC